MISFGGLVLALGWPVFFFFFFFFPLIVVGTEIRRMRAKRTAAVVALV
jgi:hypothetical protein